MKKLVCIIVVIMSILILFAGCKKCEHVYGETVVIVPPTCAKDGEGIITCTLCGNKSETVLFAHGEHEYSETVTKEPTCAVEGELKKTCNVCKHEITESIQATGKHNFTETVTKQPSCTELGKKTLTCSVCSQSTEEELPLIEHTFGEATCEEASTCSLCSQTRGEPLGHKYSKATCTAAKKCSVCGKTDGKALGHDYTKATCTEAAKCKRCGKTDGKALGHDVVNGVCTRCGQKQGAAACTLVVESLPTQPTFHYVNPNNIEFKIHPIRIDKVSDIKFADEADGSITLTCTISGKFDSTSIPAGAQYCIARVTAENGGHADINMYITVINPSSNNFLFYLTCRNIPSGTVTLTFEDVYYKAK